jgi:flagellar basal-body rod modification protein FlgD
MAVNPTGSVSTPSTAATQADRAGTTLGKDDFLKLLVAQMSNMDPMSQSNDPSQSMQQMTQFSILEQLTNLTSSQETVAAEAKQSQAIALLGKTVDYTAADQSTATGNVEKVDFASDGSIKLTIDGVTGITPSQIVGVK